MGNIDFEFRAEEWPMKQPFRIAGQNFSHAELVVVELSMKGWRGRGEACGVYYRQDDTRHMLEQLSDLRADVENGIDRTSLQNLLPAGGARNALDAALWELEAGCKGLPAWRLAGLKSVRPLPTVFTIGIDDPAMMAQTARTMTHARAIKLKLAGDELDGERLRGVRAARPDVWLGVDGNRGFTPSALTDLLPVLEAVDVKLLEQPFPIGEEEAMRDIRSPIATAADESVQDISDLKPLKGLFDIINIKLDKCGGLTHALEMEKAARALGFKVMVGNMTGTSWSQAPAFILGQRCEFRDLDGATFLASDRERAVTYKDGHIHCPDTVWGSPSS
ncbi:dipeptide epimerase [Hyphomonas sp. NPDC076881]